MNANYPIKKKCNNALLIIDVQQKIINPIKNRDQIIENIKKLKRVHEILDKSIFISEQNPLKLGATIEELLPSNKLKLFEKMDFSIAANGEFINALKSEEISSLVICGIETHICIQQSVVDLLNLGLEIFIVADAMGSRKSFDHEIALKRMHSDGAVLSTSESIIFQLCKTSDRSEFKSISNIIKNK